MMEEVVDFVWIAEHLNDIVIVLRGIQAAVRNVAVGTGLIASILIVRALFLGK
jgi:hypothetical protein